MYRAITKTTPIAMKATITKAPGVHSCVRYKLESSDVEGTARYTAVYEIDTPETPFSAGWVAEPQLL